MAIVTVKHSRKLCASQQFQIVINGRKRKLLAYCLTVQSLAGRSVIWLASFRKMLVQVTTYDLQWS